MREGKARVVTLKKISLPSCDTTLRLSASAVDGFSSLSSDIVAWCEGDDSLRAGGKRSAGKCVRITAGAHAAETVGGASSFKWWAEVRLHAQR